MVKAMWVSVVALMAAILLVTVANIPVAEAVTCLPSELAPCAEAMTSYSRPSGLCCGKLREQKPCLCGYMRNPNLRQFVSSPNAMKVSYICKIAFPNC
ncbi:putative non-specific lipid-transfer protein AKCS9 [Cardamine amara subsp. amara]|uniref:Non-specific lipid-transfer protein AKCS9 n=1 Tax=Cardamine amara subsp. amara TaxID=228776 RepID=A0ABD1BHL1_CARAN